jgi:hypothetical protein
MRRIGQLAEKYHVLIFKLACHHERLYERGPAGFRTPFHLLPPHEQEIRRREPEPNREFFAALIDDFTTTGWIYEGMDLQLRSQETQWRDNFRSRGSMTGTEEDYLELADSARAWIEILDKKIEARDLRDAARNANQGALAGRDVRDVRPGPEPMDDEVAPDEPMSMPQTSSVQKWPPVRPASTSFAPRTPSQSPSRGRRKRRRCSTPRSERSIEASNERRRSSTPRRDTVEVLERFMASVTERFAEREARLDRYEESLNRRREVMDKQFEQVMELLRSNLGGRPDPTAPTQEAPIQRHLLKRHLSKRHLS